MPIDPTILQDLSPAVVAIGGLAVAGVGTGLGVVAINAISEVRSFLVVTNEGGVENYRTTEAKDAEEAAQQQLSRGRRVVHVEETVRNARRGR